MTAERVLEKATEILSDPDRWYQGDLWNADGTAFCSTGAILEAVNLLGADFATRQRAFIALRKTLSEYYPAWRGIEGSFAIGTWNDALNRKHSEVTEMFEKAHAYAAEKGI